MLTVSADWMTWVSEDNRLMSSPVRDVSKKPVSCEMIDANSRLRSRAASRSPQTEKMKPRAPENSPPTTAMTASCPLCLQEICQSVPLSPKQLQNCLGTHQAVLSCCGSASTCTTSTT